MKRYLILLFFAGCLAINICCENAIQPQLDEIIGLYMDLITNHLDDELWRAHNVKDIYHPGMSFAVGRRRYSGIPESLTIIGGQRIFFNAKIDSIIHNREHIDYATAANHVDDVFFVKIDYSVAGVRKGNEITIFDNVIVISQYLVLCMDQNDGKYKIFDFYPEVKDGSFVSASYIVKNYAKYSSDDVIKNKLLTIIGNHS